MRFWASKSVRFPVIWGLLLCAASLTSCTPSDHFEAGVPLGREELDSIRTGIFGTAEETSAMVEETSAVVEDSFDSTETTETEEDSAAEGMVYWTEGGSVYHTNRDCRHLQKAKDVLQGSQERAARLGKERLCSACGDQKTS